MSTSEHPTGTESDLVATLASAEQRLDDAQAAVEEFGEAELERLADAYDGFTDLLARYEEPATGDGDFEEFIEFQGKIEDYADRLDEDLLLREVFEECDEYLQQRRLTEDDFAHVRDQLEPVADLVGRLQERRDARQAYRRARDRVKQRRRELGDRIADLERLVELGEADLDAPTERLREPIATYNDAVRDAFETFKREHSAREVLAFVDAMEAFPLVPYESPPGDLQEFVQHHDAGTEPVPQLLEYADYSRSKLSHYVDDADALKRAVATQQTYFRRLGADPLTVDWPPPAAGTLRRRCEELTSAVDRFAPDAVEQLRAVAALPRREDYERLRDAAVAKDRLSAAERERLRSGEIEAELREARDERERLEAALEEYPSR